MRMTKFKLAALAVLLIACASAPWLIQRQSDLKTINSLQSQLDELTRERNANENSSYQMVHAANSLPNEQLSELLKLRNEVNLLRKETNELARLRAENRQLPAGTPANPQGQPNLAAGDTVPVESLTFAGYATPEATFQSTFSSMYKGDFKTALNGLTGEFREHEEKEFAGKSEAELAAMAAEQGKRFDKSTVKIVASGLESDDQALLVAFLSAENNSHFVRMKRIDGEWKITSVNH